MVRVGDERVEEEKEFKLGCGGLLSNHQQQGAESTGLFDSFLWGEGGEAKGRRIRMSLISEMDVIMVTITKIIFIKLIERILRFEDVA